VTRRIALALLLAGAIGIVVAVVWFARDDGEIDGARAPVASSNTPLLLGTTPASAPFKGFTEAQLGVDGRCLHVVVADDQTERVQGLRQRRDLGPYDGMLFVFGAPTNTAFTMSTVPVPLEIGFYSADGSPVSRRHMKPCPHAEADCPDYHAGGAFTFALETLGGKLPSGALSRCN
jgi:uncharacterized membrane protein (UPF0127 family)